MLPPSWSCSSYQITIMNANNLVANRNQTILFFQPRFGYIDINGRNSRWLHHDICPLGYSRNLHSTHEAVSGRQYNVVMNQRTATHSAVLTAWVLIDQLCLPGPTTTVCLLATNNSLHNVPLLRFSCSATRRWHLWVVGGRRGKKKIIMFLFFFRWSIGSGHFILI